MASLAERLLKTSNSDRVSLGNDANSMLQKNINTTDVKVPMLNLALSGSTRGGVKQGITTIAGESKSFKTSFAIKIVSEYLKAHKDAIFIFYDCEFGSRKEAFNLYNIDMSRVLHNPIEDVEQLTFETMSQLKEIKKEDKVIILLDSLGALASKKEVDNALEQHSAQDMTRAKSLKAYFRMITPILNIKEVPFLCISHTYSSMVGLYQKEIIGSGRGIAYSSNVSWIITKSKDKNSKGELEGYNFTINIDKSREIRDDAKIPIKVKFDGGVFRWSGILEHALEFNLVTQEGRSHIKKHLGEGSKVCLKNLSDEELDEWYQELVDNTNLLDLIDNKYRLIKILENDISETEEE